MKKLLFAFVFLSLTLSLAELGVRLVLPAPQRIVVLDSKPGDGTAGNPASAERSGLYYTTESGRRLRPNAHVVIENHALSGRRIDIRTNSLGYRNPEIGVKTDRPRVLFLGDSITFGDYLSEEETFARRVEQLSRRAGQPVETINAAVGAIGLATELAILEETGLALEPDVVVLCFYLNDARPSRMRRAASTPAWLEWSALAQHVEQLAWRLSVSAERPRSRFDAQLETTMRSEIAAAFPAQDGAFNGAIAANVVDWGSAWSRSAQQQMEPLLARFASLARQHGFEPRIVVFPVRLQVEAEAVRDEPQRWLAARAADLEVPVLDLLPVLRQARQDGGEPLFYDHCHHTPEGNALVARSIWSLLEETVPVIRAWRG